MTQYDPTGYVKPETACSVRVVEHADFAIRLRAYFWTKDKLSGFLMEKDLLESVKKRFDKEGVEIPFPYRTIVYKKDLKKTSKLNAVKVKSSKAKGNKKK